MQRDLYRYRFSASVPTRDIESTLRLAFLATECLHGESQVRMDGTHLWDPTRRVCVIDGSTDVGHDANRLFVGFLRREYGDGAFRVDHVNAVTDRELQEACS